jgi:hypothetical protein
MRAQASLFFAEQIKCVELKKAGARARKQAHVPTEW